MLVLLFDSPTPTENKLSSHARGRWHALLCKVLLFPLVLTPVGLHAAEPETFTLQYRFSAGERLAWQVRHEFLVETEVQGYEERAEGRTDSRKVWQVESVDPQGKITLVHAVEGVQMWQKTADQAELRYDSTRDERPPAAFSALAKTVGKPLSRIVIDAHGNLLQREDLAQLVDETKESDALIVPLPAEPIPLGHVWSVRREVKVTSQQGESIKVLIRRRFRLEDVRSGRAYIQVETSVLSPINDPTARSQLVRELAQGEVVFDLQAGELVERRLELDGDSVAFSGAASRMRYRGRYVEHVVREEAASKNAAAKARVATQTITGLE